MASNPQAPLAAINEMGFFVPMPLSVPLVGQQVIQRHSTALELVVREDMSVVTDAWVDARRVGAARRQVHLASDPNRTVNLSYVDATHRHGVYIGIFEIDSSEGMLAAFQETPPLRPRLGLVHKTETSVILSVDEALSQLLGWAPDEMVGHRSIEFVHPEDHPSAISTWMDMLRTPLSRRRVRLRHRHRDGSWIWFEVTNHNLLNEPEHGYVLTEMVDVTDEMTVHEALRARELLLRGLAEALPLGVFHVDTDMAILYRNSRLEQILGQSQATCVEQQLAQLADSDRDRVVQALGAVLTDGQDHDLEVALASAGNHRAKCCAVSLRALRDDSERITGAIVCVSDITESVRLREKLQHRATFDPLTGCHNRASILDLLERSLAAPEDAQAGTGVVFVDLNHFKDLNDRYGHAAGDAALIEVVRRLTQSARAGDAVGRLGGDEFLIVCSGIASADATLNVATRLAKSLRRARIAVHNTSVFLTASVGVAWSSPRELDADALVARADMAMYRA